MNKNFSNKFYNFTLILLSIFFAFIFYNDQVAVRGGLIISNEIIFQDKSSPLQYYFLNSWTLLTQFSAILLKLGLSVKLASLVLVFFLTLILFFSCFLILVHFTENRTLSLILTIFLILFQKNLGDTDYPSLIFTIHTFGAYAQALTGLIIASLLYKNFNTSIFLTLILITIHPIVGLWLMFIILISIYYCRESYNLKTFIKGIVFGTIIILLSLIFYFYLSIDKISYDHDLFNIYMEKWDGHRAITSKLHYEYIVKTLLFFLILNIFCPKNEKYKLFKIFLNLLIISSLLLYILFKFLNINEIEFLSPIIPGRFMITYTFIAWPLVLSLIYFKLRDRKYTKNIFYLLIIIYSLMHYKDLINVKNKFNEKYFIKNNNVLSMWNEQNDVFKKLNKIENTGNIIATENSAFNILYLSKKPLLLMRSFDYLPYHPYLINSIEKILTQVYGYDFNNPPKMHYPYLDDNFIKEIFEKRTVNEWLEIKNKFNSNFLIVPKNWDLNLNLFYSDKNFSLYKIN